MSKLDLNVSYKNACILKHSLKNRIKTKERLINFIENKREQESLEAIQLPYNKNTSDENFLKSLGEERLCFIIITEEINREKERLGIVGRRENKLND